MPSLSSQIQLCALPPYHMFPRSSVPHSERGGLTYAKPKRSSYFRRLNCLSDVCKPDLTRTDSAGAQAHPGCNSKTAPGATLPFSANSMSILPPSLRSPHTSAGPSGPPLWRQPPGTEGKEALGWFRLRQICVWHATRCGCDCDCDMRRSITRGTYIPVGDASYC